MTFLQMTKVKNFMYVRVEGVIDNGLIKFIQTPGLSQCSMCIAFENRMLSGDHILVDGVGRADLEFSNPKEMGIPIKKFKNYVDENKIRDVYPGHNEFGTMKIILEKNKYLK